MMQWLALLLPVLAAVGLLALLGAPIALALGLRGFSTAIVSIPAAFAVLALSALAAPFIGVAWTALVPIVLSALLAGVLRLLRPALGVTRTRPSSPTARAHRLWVPIGAAAIGGSALAATLVMSLKAPDAVSQTYDANFHLNAVQQILQSGTASPLDMDLSSPGQAVFYPTLWHGLTALVAQITGTTIPLATNAVLFTVCAVVWTIGMVAFGRAIAGPSRSVTLSAGVLGVALPSFPLALAGYGVLYPNLLSIALLPYVLVGFMQVAGLGQARRSEVTTPGVAWLLFLGALGAATLAHPNAIHILLLWLIGPIVALVVRVVRERPFQNWDGQLRRQRASRPVRLAVAVLAPSALIVAVMVAWRIGRTSDNPWDGKHTVLGSTLDALGMSPHLEGHVWPATVVLLIGLLIAWRRPRLRWLVLSAAVMLGVYVIADGFPAAAWRTAILSPWYSDPWRLAALAWVGAFPLLVLGVRAAWAVLRAGIVRWGALSQRPRRFFRACSLLALVFLLASTQGAGAFAGVQFVSTKYASGPDAPLLSDDERALIERLPEHLPEDAVIINNPWNGGALAYALTGIPVLVPHTGGNYDPRISVLTEQLGEGTPEACAITHELGAEYVLDFGSVYVFENTPRAIPFLGITDLEDSPVVTEVDREGDAVLYRVTGCATG
ncbi:DUF6541 family protein [Leucobacter triazinivorans]|uniref:Glycosyltransferase RgtA/B/C/D-like domain-containing protein n=1 Tax=Leucobacter triazinivorans TaxID=1784719 RepID=A0A4P6KG61_9MICO|nr:DUF6541 family protein [Leucobacter triazinivorans]QBE49416.1 hypothetical protein EVS81_11690 [Leucobacter triazinivorans]